MKPESIDFQVLSRLGGERREYRAGEIIFRAGESANEFFVVREGTVAVDVNGAIIERLGSSEIFGEMALVEAKPRSATVVAETDCAVVPISEKQFLAMVEYAPSFSLAVIRTLAHRLRRANAHRRAA
ncbi:cyclic nucleotide-binding domain-containing protein [Devosia sp. CN2-171]|uniref:cyclic nucleotide-binding domain-containing protein n=1 Tax=Devosia sp. CN2-171 TaxID=3400909 RepID=UPI003BF8B17A